MRRLTPAECQQPSRRAFLHRVAGVLAAAGCSQTAPPPAVPTASNGEIIGLGQFVETGHRRFVLSQLDLDRPSPHPRLTSMTFFGHGVVIDPTARHRAIVFEKIGPGACEVDLKAGKVLRPIPPAATRLFYGHGAFTPDGTLLFATETDAADGTGRIAVRDGRTLAEQETFPTYGLKPHDCTLIDGGTTLVVTNGGGPADGDAPCVCYVDVPSRKLLERLPLTRPEFNTGHLALAADGTLAVSSAPREGTPMPMEQPGAFSLRKPGGPLVTMADPADVTARMLGETLSLAIHEPTRTAAATNPAGDLVTFWHLDLMSLLSAFEVPKPRGVALTLDGRAFILTFGADASVLLLDPETREPIPRREWAGSLITGSHIVTHRPL